ncbi:AfsR/SARP family transcriptional regulator [Herbidospora mongoliensis]|uniref:AfsR/SARP family transcriptional regulator n=1 Tax=Herbidospora mongoliensis TaxID=688067 RepID=UPI00082CC7DB|nr:BTAD domain-containing putative transcriptional regulator [Herbidospora mongoliensis]
MTTTAAHTPHRVRINLLGGFSVIADGESCAVAEGSQRLLVYLALRERPQARTAMAASLWPDKADNRACANLRSSLWRLPAPGGVPLVRAANASLQLSEHLDVDVKLAEVAGWNLVRDPAGPVDDVDSSLFFLELLPGWYDDWVVFERERLAQLQFHFLEALADALVEHHHLPQALDIALRLVRADPLREGSQRALLGVYLAERNIGQAQRQLKAYRRLINDTFGCDPSPELIAMAIQDR